MKKLSVKKTVRVLVGILIALLILEYTADFARESMARHAVQKYVNTHYSDMDLTYNSVTYSKFHDQYYVTYVNENGQMYNFFLLSPLFPTSVSHDPLEGMDETM